jgi:hypothetical protein
VTVTEAGGASGALTGGVALVFMGRSWLVGVQAV